MFFRNELYTPCGAGHSRPLYLTVKLGISIHPPRAGRDKDSYTRQGRLAIFQSTRPVRGGTRMRGTKARARTYFNPPAPCGAGPSGIRGSMFGSDFNPPAPCGAGLESNST